MTQDHHDYYGDFPLTDIEIAAWHDVGVNLPTDITDPFAVIFDFTHPAFCDAYLHLVAESTIKDKIFITEKTWQTILAGQLFMIWGNCGIVSHLRSLGVDVFDDIIDHAYDTETDHRNRLQLVHNELDRLADLDWPEIYRVTYQRRQDNVDKLVHGKFTSTYVDRLERRLYHRGN